MKKIRRKRRFKKDEIVWIEVNCPGSENTWSTNPRYGISYSGTAKVISFQPFSTLGMFDYKVLLPFPVKKECAQRVDPVNELLVYVSEMKKI